MVAVSGSLQRCYDKRWMRFRLLLLLLARIPPLPLCFHSSLGSSFTLLASRGSSLLYPPLSPGSRFQLSMRSGYDTLIYTRSGNYSAAYSKI